MSVLRQHRQGGVLHLQLHRPEKRNALDGELIAALKEALRAADAADDVRVVALSGAGEDFCSGADLAALRVVSEGSTLDNLRDSDALGELFLLPRRMRKPVVALVRGRALAGGCGLATACDLIVAEEGARFGYPEVKIGFVAAMVMAILRRNVSEKRAFGLLVEGEEIDAAEAERIGLVNRVWAADRFEAESTAFLERLAGRSASAVELTKRLLYQMDGMTFEAGLRAGADLNVIARTTDDVRTGVERFLRGGR
jgi:methylglutaconyl-CoA hydratase